ncbi:MAG: FAD-binding protein [Candidatus Mcinerneyibacterium aminivorans]|uniref:FAD-binding protein n=1 Tax=Candidatus Mcinerneyibacterium aminivorans TaxID=2703815 RepID=A0A5D0MF82_9BACT|nr:MAG: FAD-binding protein [Candidatus Mcinerneyibacterium aminivorans]
MGKLNKHDVYDVIIVGGGPAGMNAGLYSARKGLKTGLITKDFGGQTLNTSTIENYIGTKEINGMDLAEEWKSHMLEYSIDVNNFTKVEKIKKEEDVFQLATDEDDIFKSKTVILAPGAKKRHLNVTGEDKFEGKGISYCATCDAPLYEDKEVAIVGGGNSAVEAIVDLGKIAKKIHLFELLDDFTADEIVLEKIEPYKDKLETHFNTTIKEFKGDTLLEKVVVENKKTKEINEYNVNGVFVEIGQLPNTDSFNNIVKMNDSGEIITDKLCKTNVEGIFACGDATNIPYKQVVIAAGQGATAALSAYHYLLNK